MEMECVLPFTFCMFKEVKYLFKVTVVVSVIDSEFWTPKMMFSFVTWSCVSYQYKYYILGKTTIERKSKFWESRLNTFFFFYAKEVHQGIWQSQGKKLLLHLCFLLAPLIKLSLYSFIQPIIQYALCHCILCVLSCEDTRGSRHASNREDSTFLWGKRYTLVVFYSIDVRIGFAIKYFDNKKTGMIHFV
jgi:hypothetical protein